MSSLRIVPNQISQCLAVTVVLLTTSAARADDWNRQWTTGSQASLHVDTNDAGVEIDAVDGDRIEAVVTTKGWPIGPSGVQIIDRQMGNHLDLELHIPKGNWSFPGHEHSVLLRLRVPRQTAANIRTGDGHIRLTGLKGPTQLNTGDGSIEGDRLDGALDAKTGDGHIRISGRFDAVTLHTQDGGVDFEALQGSKMTNDWRVQTGDGHVTLRLPENFAANLDAHTGDGSIHTDLTLSMHGAHGEHEARGTLNGGGMNLIVRTGDGSVHIERL